MQALYRGELGLFLRQKVPPDRGYVAADIPHELWKIWGPLFSLLSKSSQSNFMLCTALVLLSASAHNTTLALLLT